MSTYGAYSLSHLPPLFFFRTLIFLEVLIFVEGIFLEETSFLYFVEIRKPFSSDVLPVVLSYAFPLKA